MQPKHLLIIDDEDHIREVACLSLEMTQGWRVSTASSGTLGVSLSDSLDSKRKGTGTDEL